LSLLSSLSTTTGKPRFLLAVHNCAVHADLRRIGVRNLAKMTANPEQQKTARREISTRFSVVNRPNTNLWKAVTACRDSTYLLSALLPN
jgi:hypothetical protein